MKTMVKIFLVAFMILTLPTINTVYAGCVGCNNGSCTSLDLCFVLWYYIVGAGGNEDYCAAGTYDWCEDYPWNPPLLCWEAYDCETHEYVDSGLKRLCFDR